MQSRGQTMSDLEYLLQLLPAPLVASLAGVQDVGLICGNREALDLVKFAASIARKIEAAESATVAASWLTTANSVLDFDLPVKAVREGSFYEVENAASAFVSGYAD